MKVLIEVDTDNAAFADDDSELARVLSDACEQVVDGRVEDGDSVPLFDVNGNRVGWVTLR